MGERLSFSIIAAAVAVGGCEAASLQSQSAATFAIANHCDAARVTAIQRPHRKGAWYELFDVRGCGQREVYVCATDVGCVRPEEVPGDPAGGAAFRLPPTLVDQAPPPPPPPPDSQDGS